MTMPASAVAAATLPVSGAGKIRSPKRRTYPLYYFFLYPTLILLSIAITVPAAVGIFFSFTNYIGVGEWEFVQFRNYSALFTDPAIRQAYLFTIGIALATVIVVNIISFLLAVGLTSKIKFKVTLRAIFVIPMVVSGIIIAFIFKFIFANTVPSIAGALGISSLELSILENPSLAWLAIVIVTAWQAIPSTLLIYIAGILSIPGDVYEAADIDGASKRQQLTRITLPLVFGYVIINIVIGFKNYLNAYDIIIGLTDGGPGTATRSVAMTIIRGFYGGDYAYQMANATVFFILAIIIALLQLRLNRKDSF